MSGSRHTLLALGVVVVAVLALCSTGSVVATDDAPTVEKHVTVSSVDSNTVHIEVRYSLPPSVDTATFHMVDRSGEGRHFLEAVGLELVLDDRYNRVYRWTRGNRTGPETVILQTNVTLPRGEMSRSDIGVTGDGWQYVSLPSIQTSWSPSTAVDGVERSTSVEGAGQIAGSNAFLGAIDVEKTTADGQTFHLVVPKSVSLESTNEQLLENLAFGAKRFPTVDDDPHVYVFVLPKGVEVTHVQGEAWNYSFWVHASAGIDSPDDTWLHEYVHTQQRTPTTGSAAWFTEATAEYYASALAAHQSHTKPEAAAAHVAQVEDGDAVLANRSTWDDADVEYRKGSLVVAAMDARIRRATNGSASMLDLFRDVFTANEPVTNTDLRRAFAAYVGEEAAREFWRSYVTDSGTPALPERHALVLRPDGDADGDGTTNWVEADRGDAPFGGETPALEAVATGQYRTTSAFGGNPLVLSGLGLLTALNALLMSIFGTASLLSRVTGRVPGVLVRRSTPRYTALMLVSFVALLLYVYYG